MRAVDSTICILLKNHTPFLLLQSVLVYSYTPVCISTDDAEQEDTTVIFASPAKIETKVS